jgi:hypothetical protein
VILNLIALALLVYRQLNISHVDFWFIIPYVLFLVFLATRARVLKSRVAELVDLAAQRAGLQRILRRGKIAPLTTTPQVQVPVNAMNGASSPAPIKTASMASGTDALQFQTCFTLAALDSANSSCF